MKMIFNRRPPYFPPWIQTAVVKLGLPVHPIWQWIDIKSRNECWNYLSSKDTFGYGRYYNKASDGRWGAISAHRLVLCLCKGISLQALKRTSLVVRHKCDNPGCCNPRHLLTGTQKDNSDDKIRRGRAVYAVGSAVHNAVLTPTKVRAIRKYGKQGMSYSELARRYSVTPATIKKVLTRKTWRHVK